VLGQLIVQDHIQQGLVNVDAAVVFDKPHLAKAIHEKADAGAGGADHLRQGFLGNLRNQRLWLARLAELGPELKKVRLVSEVAW
jgi:hypothetical protein